MGQQLDTKTFGDSYLFSKGKYHDEIFKFIISSTRIDKNDKSFDEIRYIVKRNQTTSALLNTLDRDSVVLMHNPTPMPRSFKVFTAVDAKQGSKDRKVFVDVSDILVLKDGEWYIRNDLVIQLMSRLVCAVSNLIYFSKENSSIINNTTMITSGTICFAKLFTNIIDYMRLGGVETVRETVLYLSSRYYLEGMLKKDGPSTKQRARQIAGINEREAMNMDIFLTKQWNTNIDDFVKVVAEAIRASDLKLDNFIEKWMWLYGPGTQFATELYQPFSDMITNAYMGGYINNQKTIEKLIGGDMVSFTTALLKVGSERV